LISCHFSQHWQIRHSVLPGIVTPRASTVCWDGHVRLPTFFTLIYTSDIPIAQKAYPLFNVHHSDHFLVLQVHGHSRHIISALPSKHHKAPLHSGHWSMFPIAHTYCRITHILCAYHEWYGFLFNPLISAVTSHVHNIVSVNIISRLTYLLAFNARVSLQFISHPVITLINAAVATPSGLPPMALYAREAPAMYPAYLCVLSCDLLASSFSCKASWRNAPGMM